MKLATYSIDNQLGWGIINNEEILAIESPQLSSLQSFLASELAKDELVTLAEKTSLTVPLDAVKLLPPVLTPSKILCIGLNYKDHRTETNRAPTDRPVVFLRLIESFVGHNQPLTLPPTSSQFDYEGEIALVIGKPGYKIHQADALDHVAGITCLNDGSIRDYQFHTHQYTPGKNFLESGSIGPWIQLIDDKDDLNVTSIKTRLNGEIVQEGNLSQLIFPLEELIAYCSSWTKLNPGDIIATGTPGGVGMSRKPPLWMKPGDVCEVIVDQVGVLRNTIQQGE